MNIYMILGVVSYSILCFYFAFILDGFNGLKFLIVWTICTMVALIVFFVLDYRLFIKSGDEINPKAIDKRNKKMIFFVLFLVCFVWV